MREDSIYSLYFVFFHRNWFLGLDVCEFLGFMVCLVLLFFITNFTWQCKIYEEYEVNNFQLLSLLVIVKESVKSLISLINFLQKIIISETLSLKESIRAKTSSPQDIDAKRPLQFVLLFCMIFLHFPTDSCKQISKEFLLCSPNN